MSFRKFATAAALASALTVSSVSQAAIPVVASAHTEGKSDNFVGLLFGMPLFVVGMGTVFVAFIAKVTVDNSTSP
jgi:hypothetical protein